MAVSVRESERPVQKAEGGAVDVVERAMAFLLPYFRRWAHGRLPHYARRRMDTGDVVQEAMVGVLRNLGELDQADPEVLRRYLITSIQNRICDEVRRAQIGEVVNGASARFPDARPTPHDEAVEGEYQRQYRSALLQLSERDRQLLVGRIEMQLSYAELAIATQHVSADAARAAARRAALRLASLMGRTPEPLSATDLARPAETAR